VFHHALREGHRIVFDAEGQSPDGITLMQRHLILFRAPLRPVGIELDG
jgi:hypothetical protein